MKSLQQGNPERGPWRELVASRRMDVTCGTHIRLNVVKKIRDILELHSTRWVALTTQQ